MDNPTNEPFFASKTMVHWALIFGLAAFIVVFAAVMLAVFHIEIPYVREFFSLLGVGGATGTARNVISDSPVRALNASQATGLTPGQLQTPALPPTAPPLTGLGAPPTTPGS